MDRVGRFAIKVVIGIALWAIVVIGFLAMANVVLAAEQEPTSPYREVIMSMSEQEIVEIQQVLYWEAGTDTWEGRVATAQVMFNRVLSDKFPNTVHEVLSQTNPRQYSTWYKRNRAKYGEQECDAIEFLCDCNIEDLYIDTNRLYQDCKPIGKNPIKVGKQYFGY